MMLAARRTTHRIAELFFKIAPEKRFYLSQSGGGKIKIKFVPLGGQFKLGFDQKTAGKIFPG
jgi:hypothetical protein